MESNSKCVNRGSNIVRAHKEHEQKNWDNLLTSSSLAQQECEETCAYYLIPFTELSESERTTRISSGLFKESGEVDLLISKHEAYLKRHLGDLGYRCMSQASSKPWLYYHVLNSLDLLGFDPCSSIEGRNASSSIENNRTMFGGYAGSENEYPHTMTTYAAVNSLICLERFDDIHRNELYRFFLSQKQPDGSFSVHVNGESDCRSCYCVLSISRLLHMLTPELTSGVKEFILSCQTYEGGFGGCPCTEAHGGYTFCAVACLSILGCLHECDLVSLEHWLYGRQCSLEGGFNGRTNKLVDGCYSWYVGAAIRLVSEYRGIQPLWNRNGLLEYCFKMEQCGDGGLRDKPEMRSDLYHTMYCLCGLSTYGGVLSKDIDCIHCISKTKCQKCMDYYSVYSNDHKSLLEGLDSIRIEVEPE